MAGHGSISLATGQTLPSVMRLFHQTAPHGAKGSARQIYGSILVQTALNMSTQAQRKFIRKPIL
jgi:hypothetical protein